MDSRESFNISALSLMINNAYNDIIFFINTLNEIYPSIDVEKEFFKKKNLLAFDQTTYSHLLMSVKQININRLEI